MDGSPNVTPVEDSDATDEESRFSGFSSTVMVGFPMLLSKEEQRSKSYERNAAKVSENLQPRRNHIPTRKERQRTDLHNIIADWLSEPLHPGKKTTGVRPYEFEIEDCGSTDGENQFQSTASVSDSTAGRSEYKSSLNMSKAKRSTLVPKPIPRHSANSR
jgi:hypothetical protein